MRAEILGLYRTLHTWTGLLTGMLLFIAFYAGAITVFKDPVGAWATPPADPEPAASVPLDEVPALVARTLATHPEAGRELWVHLDPDDPGRGRVTWTVRPEDAGEHDTLSTRHYVAVPTADGEVRAVEATPSKVGEFIHLIHSVVGLPVDNDVTRIFMGVVASLYWLSLISGLVMVLPRLARDLFALRLDGRNVWRAWQDTHVLVGVASLPFHLVIAVTATVFAFHDGIYAVQDLVVYEEGATRRAFGGPPATEPRDPADLRSPAAIVADVRALSPGFAPYAVQYAGLTTPRAMARVWGHDPRGFGYRTYGALVPVDPYSGRIVTTEYLPGRQSAAGTVLTGAFAAHFATFGGALVRWLYFGLALAGAWLFYTGNLLWVEARRKKRPKRDPHAPVPEQDRSTRWMAAATVGVCLGAIAGISLTLASAKWLHALGLAPAAWHHTVYYGVFLGSVGWAFLRGGPRAAVELLGLAAVTTLAVPLTSLVGIVLPGTGLWAHLDAASLAVDATALLTGLVFVDVGRRTARRVRHGPPDSVWSRTDAVA